MRKQQGITLLELLISMSILVIILVITFSAFVSGLKIHNSQEAITASQAKLRRTVEVFTQELRSAVLGGITNTPFISADQSISFMLLDGGAGYHVLPHDSGNNNSFRTSRNLQIASTATGTEELGLEVGDQAMLLNGAGEALVFKVDNLQRLGLGTWNIVHNRCGNGLDYTLNTLLFRVNTVGIRYDADEGNLNIKEGTDQEETLAFDIGAFDIRYVYLQPDGSPLLPLRSAPFTDGNGNPKRRHTLPNGTPVTLARLQVTLESSGDTGSKRQYTSQIGLASYNTSFNIRAVEQCGS